MKEGPGGLRDIQTIAWVARRYFGSHEGARPGLRDLFDHGFLTEEEFRSLHDGQDFLWQARTALHYLAGRREDRLLFDIQIAIAAHFGYRDADHNLGVEQFMKRYYRTIQHSSRLNELLLQLFRERFLDGEGRAPARRLNRRFQVRNGEIEVVDGDAFPRHPFALLEIFLLLRQHPELGGVRASTIRHIRRNLHLVDEEFRRDLACRSLFLEILREPHGLARALRRMHAYGILGRYLPEFGRITGLMQFDLFHAYTVDEHLLRTVAYLRRFGRPDHREELPHCSDVFATLPKPELLHLAGLFHDIAKGRGSNHSEDGERDAAAFCERHGISRFDAGLVGWLVRHHLTMSMTAQREDISDPAVVRRFADLVGDGVRLDYLYLLTIADMRATNPNLWTDWKDTLLHDLYQAVRRVLLHGVDARLPATAELVRECRDEARRQLAESGLATSLLEDLWETLEPDYFVLTLPEAVAWHAAEILGYAAPPVVAVRTHRKRTEVFFHDPDRDRLFAAATTLLERAGLTVVDARVFTTATGMSFDSFTVAEPAGEPIEEPRRREEIRRALARGLSGTGEGGIPDQSPAAAAGQELLHPRAGHVRRTPRQRADGDGSGVRRPAGSAVAHRLGPCRHRRVGSRCEDRHLRRAGRGPLPAYRPVRTAARRRRAREPARAHPARARPARRRSAAGDGRKERHLVAVRDAVIGLDVLEVDGSQQVTGERLAAADPLPHLFHGRRQGGVQAVFAAPHPLPETRKILDRDRHRELTIASASRPDNRTRRAAGRKGAPVPGQPRRSPDCAPRRRRGGCSVHPGRMALVLTHFRTDGAAHMVDVGAKDETHRVAIAEGRIEMRAETLRLILQGGHDKGDVLAVARVAAIQGAKRTADLVPLCHPIPLTRIEVDLEAAGERAVHCRARTETVGRTGVEMEALTAVQVGLLTIYDMCKAVDRGMTIAGVRLVEKSGGRSGHWRVDTEQQEPAQ